jgi:hypothetical protein
MRYSIEDLIEATRIAQVQAQFYAEELQVFQEEAALQAKRTCNRLKEANVRFDAVKR